MKEPDIDEVANRSGPESCVCARKDIGEALTGVHIGGAIEPRNDHTWSADALKTGGRQHRRQRYTRAAFEPRAVEEPDACTQISMRENREVP